MTHFDAQVVQKDKFLEVTVSGKLTVEAYDMLGEHIEQILAAHAPVRLLFAMSNFQGWTASGLWKDMIFEAKHRGEIDRVALVGDRAWQHGLAFLCRPFMAAQLRYFGSDRIAEARTWLEEPVADAAYEGMPDEMARLLAALASHHGRERENARHEIAKMGQPAVPALAQAAQDGRWQVRWEVAKALAEIDAESTIPPLVRLLREGDDIRWIAAERLKHLGRPAVEAVLRDLSSHADSVGLRLGAHHVLNELDDTELQASVAPVVSALEHADPGESAPVAADAALQRLGELGASARS